MKNRRNVIVGILVFATLILGGIAIYVAYQVTLQQSPTDSSADEEPGAGFEICSTTLSFNGCGGKIPGSGTCTTDSGALGICKGGLSGSNYICSCQGTLTNCGGFSGSCKSACNTNETSLTGTDCEEGSVKVCCVPTNTGGGTSGRTTLTSCTATCNDSDGCTCPSGCNTSGNINNGVTCGGTSTSGGGSCSGACFTPGSTYNGVTVNNCGSVGRVTGSGSCSSSGDLCCAIQGSTGGGTTVDSRSVCGGKCTTVADCKPAATAGIEVTCRNGMCENAACPSGKTVPGANCACGSLNACGAPCSDEVGLCQTGSTCGFLLPNTNNVSAESCLSQAYTTNQRCLPLAPQGGYTLSQCGDIDTVFLTTSTGSRVTNVNLLLDACGQNTVVGSGTSVVCGDGICGSSESNITCPADCGSLPGTAIINDRVDAIIVGILLIFLGLSLYFRVDIFKRK